MTALVSNFAFNTPEEAIHWMHKDVDDPFIDNTRFAYEDDFEGMKKYLAQKEDGCCGFYDLRVTVNGRPAMIGCNYGH